MLELNTQNWRRDEKSVPSLRPYYEGLQPGPPPATLGPAREDPADSIREIMFDTT